MTLSQFSPSNTTFSHAPAQEATAASRLVVIDIGARAGLHPRWRGLPIDAVGLDADEEEWARLNASSKEVRFFPYAVGRSDGESATLHLTSGAGCTSIFEPNQALLAIPSCGPADSH